MNFVLTPRLIDYLIKKGYRYCLSKTVYVNTADTGMVLMLKPLRVLPQRKRLPQGFHTYFSINNEPQLMAYGISGTMAFMELNDADLQQYSTLHHTIIN